MPIKSGKESKSKYIVFRNLGCDIVWKKLVSIIKKSDYMICIMKIWDLSKSLMLCLSREQNIFPLVPLGMAMVLPVAIDFWGTEDIDLLRNVIKSVSNIAGVE